MAPKPPTCGAPRRSRGAPLFTWGPRHGPQTPECSERPGGSRGAPLSRTPRAVRSGPAEPGAPLNYGRTMRRGWRREKWADIVAAANRFATSTEGQGKSSTPASVPARLAGGWRPGLGTRRALHVVHLAVEEDERLAILDGLAARGAGALLLHVSSLPPG